MRLDALVRLIGNLEFYQLRELSLHYLALSGYRNPTLTDGWSDGGTDLRVLQADGTPSNTVFQVSVEKNWKTKLKSDINKATANYKPKTFIYMSSRRIAEVEFARMATDYRAQGLALIKVDNQALASLFFEQGKIALVLTVAGLDGLRRPEAAPQRTAKEDAVYAYLFLSEEVHTFRHSVIDRAVLSHVLDHTGLTRTALVSDLGVVLGLHDNQDAQIYSSLDRLLMSGAVVVRVGGDLGIEATARENIESARIIANSDWLALGKSLKDVLSPFLPSRKQSTVSSENLLGVVGPALISASALTADAVEHGQNARKVLLPRLRERLAELDAFLTQAGVDPAKRDQAMRELVDVAANTPAGKSLVAAELFMMISGLEGDYLALALGQDLMPEIILDASVAIPMMASLLFRPGSSRYFVSSHELYRQAISHGAKLHLPEDYLEEAASHLIEAWRNYRSIVGHDPALKFSTNAFVSHFSELLEAGETQSFESYLRGYGVRANTLTDGNFKTIRGIVEDQLRGTLKRYRIGVIYRETPARDDLKRAKEEVAYAIRELDLTRGNLILEHDSSVIAYLDKHSRELPVVFATWDRLFLDGCRADHHVWSSLDPAALSDLMSLAAGGDSGAVVSPVSWARSLLEEDQSRASTIWDWLAKQEKENLNDASLLAQARAFVDDYVSRTKPARPHELAAAWTAWK